jgi:hypothetical protein
MHINKIKGKVFDMNEQLEIEHPKYYAFFLFIILTILTKLNLFLESRIEPIIIAYVLEAIILFVLIKIADLYFAKGLRKICEKYNLKLSHFYIGYLVLYFAVVLNI